MIIDGILYINIMVKKFIQTGSEIRKLRLVKLRFIEKQSTVIA